MFHKALWMRNYKLAASAVWALYLVLFFLLPFSFYGKAANFKKEMDRFRDHPGDFNLYFHFQGGEIAVILTLILVGMAALLIGQERTTHSTDLTFALPFSRKDIFLSKWLFGAAHIITSLLVNLLLCVLILKFSVLSEVTNAKFLLEFTSFVIPTSLAIFSFCMFIGTIAGTMVSQFILSLIFIFFPIGFLTLLGSFFTFNGFLNDPMHRLDGSLNILGKISELITLPIPILHFFYYADDSSKGMIQNELQAPSYNAILVACVYLLITLLIGTWLFSITKNENNGKLLVFERGKRFFICGVVLCFALLGGMFGGEIFGSYGEPSYLAYYFSAAIGGIISYFILKKFINLQLRLTR
ncbi:ABC transporter permease subunit [Bacillus sp. NEB1478]|uniref:ABC transporter permease subunit n=1 Tax=Bacillus sp. NEB1478 TaxID=3073816 RepID=UPI002872CF77|nr:ABC transporter permease subunit [Bacillus sp. NEB1478]WNB91389.1 ABC transporter permease subunit [Bacillus sp. NEB1478]